MLVPSLVIIPIANPVYNLLVVLIPIVECAACCFAAVKLSLKL